MEVPDARVYWKSEHQPLTSEHSKQLGKEVGFQIGNDVLREQKQKPKPNWVGYGWEEGFAVRCAKNVCGPSANPIVVWGVGVAFFLTTVGLTVYFVNRVNGEIPL